MILSDLLDQSISKIRFNTINENQQGVQEFQSQIRLANKKVVLMPNYPDTQSNLLEDYQKNKASSFQTAKRCGLASRLLFRNRKIVDIHFEYMENEPVANRRGIFELDNGKYITENKADAKGIENSELVVLNRNQFENLSSEQITYRSLRKDILEK